MFIFTNMGSFFTNEFLAYSPVDETVIRGLYLVGSQAFYLQTCYYNRQSFCSCFKEVSIYFPPEFELEQYLHY